MKKIYKILKISVFISCFVTMLQAASETYTREKICFFCGNWYRGSYCPNCYEQEQQRQQQLYLQFQTSLIQNLSSSAQAVINTNASPDTIEIFKRRLQAFLSMPKFLKKQIILLFSRTMIEDLTIATNMLLATNAYPIELDGEIRLWLVALNDNQILQEIYKLENTFQGNPLILSVKRTMLARQLILFKEKKRMYFRKLIHDLQSFLIQTEMTQKQTIFKLNPMDALFIETGLHKLLTCYTFPSWLVEKIKAELIPLLMKQADMAID